MAQNPSKINKFLIFFAYLVIPREMGTFLLIPFLNPSRWFLVKTKGSPLWYQVRNFFFALTKKSNTQKRTRFSKEMFFVNKESFISLHFGPLEGKNHISSPKIAIFSPIIKIFCLSFPKNKTYTNQLQMVQSFCEKILRPIGVGESTIFLTLP